MKIIHTRAALQDYKAQLAGSAGFVPTMGALHEGHLSLVDIAKARADHVIVSIFVNPTQFAPGEDFDAYPRTLEADANKLGAAGVSVLYAPSAEEIYPGGDRSSTYKAGAAAQGLESDFRPHFFDGVVNVVARLFDHVRPDLAVFGEKDYQQLQVIREMVEAYNMGIEIIGGPIARDSEGLALSSRNAYLSAEHIVIARQMNKILRRVADGALAIGDAPQALLGAGFDKVDYVAQRWGRILAAAYIGSTRLIDNV